MAGSKIEEGPDAFVAKELREFGEFLRAIGNEPLTERDIKLLQTYILYTGCPEGARARIIRTAKEQGYGDYV